MNISKYRIILNICTYSIGGPIGSYHFVWPIPGIHVEDSLCENQKIIADNQAAAPVYH